MQTPALKNLKITLNYNYYNNNKKKKKKKNKKKHIAFM